MFKGLKSAVRRISKSFIGLCCLKNGKKQKSHLFLLLSFPFLLILSALSSQVSSFTTDFPILDRPTEPLPEERVFQQWKQKHAKIYKNEKEEEMRHIVTLSHIHTIGVNRSFSQCSKMKFGFPFCRIMETKLELLQ